MQTQRRRMLVVCPFPQRVAAGQRLKYEQYFDDWRAQGFDIDVSPFMDMTMWGVTYKSGHLLQKAAGVLRGHVRRLRDMVRISRYDVVYVFMWVTPFGTSLLEKFTRSRAKSLIFDVEDNVLVDLTLPASYNPNNIIRFLKSPRKARYLIRTADHVITSSPFLNDVCLEINEGGKCTYISSSVDTDRFLPAPPQGQVGKVTVGWTGTFSSKIYLDLLRPVFVELAKRVPYRLKIIGNFDYELEGVDLEVIQWTSEREVEDLQSFDIGVYPLPTDDWVLGKSGLKAIQYMAFGIPTVATEIGTTPLIMENGLHGLLVRTDDEWLAALERLVRDPELRHRLGEAARRNAVERFSTKAIAANYMQVLNDVVGAPR